MKEIILRLTDEVAACLSGNAREKGLTSEELIKFIVGTFVQGENRMLGHLGPHIILGYRPDKHVVELVKENLKAKIRSEGISCNNCTVKLTEQDIDNEKCGTCGASLGEALGGEHDSS